jgi:membrane-associated PAP2 superfamily phosphatase
MKPSLNQLFLVLDILIGLSLLILLFNADLGLSRLVVEAGNQWPGRLHEPWKLLYHMAPVPGFILAACALAALLGGFFYRNWKRFRRQAIFVLLLLALGPGLVVNVILKDHLGRPRPQELIEFGGRYDFVQFWQSGTDMKNSSFPSGHAAIGFFTMAPWFIYRRKKPGLARIFLAGGLFFGTMIGAARILQGAHFISDILWAGGLVYLIGELLARSLRPDHL